MLIRKGILAEVFGDVELINRILLLVVVVNEINTIHFL